MFGIFKRRLAEQDQPMAGREFFRACNVYCRPEADRVVVASVFNHGGLIAEKPDGASQVGFSDATALHAAVRAALANCECAGDFDYSKQKPSDWPAFQASGYKTIKRFEAEFIRLLIKGVNEKNLFYEVISPEFGEFGLHQSIIVNAHSENHGEAIQYIVKSYLICKAAVEGTV